MAKEFEKKMKALQDFFNLKRQQDEILKKMFEEFCFEAEENMKVLKKNAD